MKPPDSREYALGTNDAEIARHVIEIKSVIERIREMIQNVE